MSELEPHGVPPENIGAFRPAESRESIVRELMGVEGSLQIPGQEGATSLTRAVEDRTFDPGIGRERRFQPPGQEPETTPPVDILRRSAFIHTMRTWRDSGLQLRSFLTADIGNLRGADLARDAEGNSAADLMLNRVAGAIQSSVKGLPQTDDARVTVGRYGGDEFVIGFAGNWNPEQLAQAQNSITELIRTQQGYFTSDPEPSTSNITQQNISLKNDEMMVTEIPADPFDKEMFDWFLDRGLILNTEDIARIKTRWTETGRQDFRSAFEEHKSRYAVDIYPGSIEPTDTVAKAHFLQDKHREFGTTYALAETLDSMEQDTQKKVHTEALNKFIENVVYDQLLGENFYTSEDFQQHIALGNIHDVHVFDLKFIKEINDNVGLVQGDDVIRNFWNQIKLEIDLSDFPNLIFGRRGGTIFIGTRSGNGGAPLEPLRLRTYKFFENGMKEANIHGATLPIGFSSGTVREENGDNVLALRDLFDDSDRQWYRESYQLMHQASSVIDKTVMDRLEEISPEELEQLKLYRPDGRLNSEALLLHYFASPKRAHERRRLLQEAGGQES